MRRVYFPAGDGMVKQSDFAQGDDGQYYNSPSKGIVCSQHKALANGGVIRQMGANGTIQSAETVSGQADLARLETADYGGSGSERQIFLNIKTGAEAFNNLVGDGMGLLAIGLGNNITTIPNTVTIGGTWGTNTLEVLKNFSALAPLRVHGLHIFNPLVGTNTPFFTTGTISVLEAAIDNTAPQETPINLRKLVKGNTFDKTVREIENHRFTWAPFMAYKIFVPTDTEVTFTWTVRSVESAYNMKLV